MKEIDIFNNIALKFSYNINWKAIKPIAIESITHKGPQHNLEVNGLTSYANEIETSELECLKPLFNFLKPIYLDYCYNTLKVKKIEEEIQIQNAWFSKYTNKGYVSNHRHINSICVACLYVKKAKNAGDIEFFNETNEKQIIELKENEVLLFPGNIFHKSQPNLSNKDRWTLTMNIGYKSVYSINEIWA